VRFKLEPRKERVDCGDCSRNYSGSYVLSWHGKKSERKRGRIGQRNAARLIESKSKKKNERRGAKKKRNRSV